MGNLEPIDQLKKSFFDFHVLIRETGRDQVVKRRPDSDGFVTF